MTAVTPHPDAAVPVAVDIRVAGAAEPVTVGADGWATLLTALRAAGHTEVKEACHEGRCGASAVLVDGELRLACLVLAARAGGATVTTAGSPACPRAREALVEAGAIQCGYCIPGVAVSLTWAEAVGAAAEDALAATVCRCGCHVGFRQAAEALGLAAGPAAEPGRG